MDISVFKSDISGLKTDTAGFLSDSARIKRFLLDIFNNAIFLNCMLLLHVKWDQILKKKKLLILKFKCVQTMNSKVIQHNYVGLAKSKLIFGGNIVLVLLEGGDALKKCLRLHLSVLEDNPNRLVQSDFFSDLVS